MVSKFALFAILTFITGNFMLALLGVLAIYFFIDFWYLGLSRTVVGRIRTAREIRELQREVSLNPHNAAALSDLGRLLVLNGRHQDAVAPLERAIGRLGGSDETNYYLGLAYLKTGKEKEGEDRIINALKINPRFRYGEPFLRLGEYYHERGKNSHALTMLERFQEIHSSSVEGFYLLGEVYRKLGETEKAKESYRKSIEAFRHSPYYKKREERKWVWKSRIALRQL